MKKIYLLISLILFCTNSVSETIDYEATFQKYGLVLQNKHVLREKTWSYKFHATNLVKFGSSDNVLKCCFAYTKFNNEGKTIFVHKGQKYEVELALEVDFSDYTATMKVIKSNSPTNVVGSLSYYDILQPTKEDKLVRVLSPAQKKLLAEKKLKEEAEKKLKEEQKLAAKEEEAKKLKLAELDKSYSNVCKKGWFGRGFEKGTKQYEDCLINEDNKVIAKEKERENLSIAEKKRLESEAKLEAEKFSKMSADDRRDYTCTKKFGFKKNSTKFQDCRFKLFAGEMELEKLQIQKELAQAKLDAAKASEAAARATAQLARSTQERQEALANAQIQASQMQSAAAAAQAYAIQQQSAIDLINNGLNMMSPRSSSTMNLRTNCTYHARMLSCY